MEKIRSRAWCFTLSNYDDVEFLHIKDVLSNVKYGIVGKEIAPTTNTPHLQGYLYMEDAKSFKSVKKLLGQRVHLEKANGNPCQNQAYCQKGGAFIEFGVIPKQGERVDLEIAKKEILEGKKVDDIVLEDPFFYHQYGRTLHKIEDLRMRKVFRTQMTEGLWVYGKTGTGKSEYAFKNYTPETHYIWKYDNGWQDGYVQQDIVIIDEFRGQIPYCELLMLIDKHPNASVRRRGREPMPFTSKKVIITSSMRPEEVYHNLSANDSLDQLIRRLKIIELIKQK